MADLIEELDRMRQALAQLFPAQPPEPAADQLRGVGAPQHLRPGSRVRDPVTDQEGEVIGYARTGVIHPPAGAGGG